MRSPPFVELIFDPQLAAKIAGENENLADNNLHYNY